jgi:hypothetical protein
MRPRTWQVSQNVPTDTAFLSDKAGVLIDTINGTLYYYICKTVKIA